MRKLFYLFPITIILLFAFCEQRQGSPRIKIENGIPVVYNSIEPEPIPGKPSKMILEEELSVGVEEGQEEYMFSFIPALDVDEEGRMYVVDAKGAHIRVFDNSGKYLQTIGRKGKGPGEMLMPWSIHITPQKEIMVLDSMNYNLQFFSLKGDFLRSLKIPMGMVFTDPKVDSKGNIINIVKTYSSYNEKNELIKYNFESEDVALSTDNVIFSFSHPKIIYMNSPRFIWQLMKNDNIIWGYPEKYELNILNPKGKPIKKIIKEYKPARTTQKMKDSVSQIKKRRGLDIKVSEETPAYRRIFVDDVDRILVLTWEKAKTEGKDFEVVDVFDPYGIYMTKIYLRTGIVVCKKNKLYTVEETKEGFSVVKRYNVIWK
ncbi:MAG: 6-bladed beta-propeller [Acidobacteriota bacterium]